MTYRTLLVPIGRGTAFIVPAAGFDSINDSPGKIQWCKLRLPEQARFFDVGWSGIVMSYDSFRKSRQPENVLIGLLQSAYEVVNEEN